MACISPAAGGGSLQGTVLLKDEDGQLLYADWVRVLLTSAAVDIPVIGDLTRLDRQKRYERVLGAHIDFFKNVQARLADPDYLVADTLTTPDGSFKFFGLRPGRYFVVVTFPSMIAGFKVAWQVPALVAEDHAEVLRLDNGNMALPTYKR
jgi:hypothetical protein